MRILVISRAAWNTTNAFGNTVTNWFDGWEGCEFYHFFTRQQEPNTKIVDKYLRICEIDILKKRLFDKDVGITFTAGEIENIIDGNKKSNEQKLIVALHRNKNEIIYWGIEKLWLSKKWISKAFLQFIDDANPDILFAFANAPYILAPAIECLKNKKPDVKVALWIADDILTGYEKTAWYRRGYLRKGIDYCLNIADKLYGASVEISEKYSQIYGKEITPLYKGCTFDKPLKENKNSPLRLVYAGNLLYGRIDTLKEIIKALRVINADGNKVVLEVYSNTPIADEEKKEWFDENNAFYMGIRPYEEIKDILNKADIVLHVESFDKEQIEIVKYSFSTKIIDCLQSGSCVMAIGPKGLASIDYFERVDGAVVVNEVDELGITIDELLYEDATVTRAKMIRSFALEHHEIGKVRKKLRADFEGLLGQHTNPE